MFAVPLSLGLNPFGESNFILATVLLIGSIAAAVWLCIQLASMLTQKDPQFIVIDEIVGFLLANFLAPFSFAALLCSLALFRFFDISKILPSRQIGTATGRRRHSAG
jgi:phosphatidylglycerophosphatase A